MNNEKMNQMIDEVYENYCKNADKGTFSRKWLKLKESVVSFNIFHPIPLYTQEEFINKCKTDSEFSERWELKIEERELSQGERLWICSRRHGIRFGTNDGPTWYNPDNPNRDKLKWMTEGQKQLCDYKNIPTKLITITYKNEKTESYE